MNTLLWLSAMLSLALYLIPAAFFRKGRYTLAREYLVSNRGVTDGVFQNSSLAYAIQLATFGPFFVWGVSGDWIQGVWNSAFYCLELLALYIFRKEIGQFLSEALANDKSITIHEFLAQSHGGSSWIRLTASVLTIVALLGILMSEMFGVFTVLAPLLDVGPNGRLMIIAGLACLMFAYSVVGGNDGVMRTDQLQLGLIYLGVFVAAIGMIALMGRVSATDNPSAATAVASIGFLGLAWLLVRRFRFIEPDQTLPDQDSSGKGASTSAWRAYLRLEQLVGLLVVLVITILVFAAALRAVDSGLLNVLEATQRSLHTSTNMSVLGLIALALLPVGYQIVDITNWQRFAAAGRPGNCTIGPGKPALVRYAVEAPIIWVSLLTFGALGGSLIPNLANSSDPFGTFVPRLLSSGDLLGAVTASAFVVAVLAIGLSTMGAVFSAIQCAFQYDVIPAFESFKACDLAVTNRIRITRMVSIGAYATVVATLYALEAYLAFGRDSYLALLLAFYSAQLAFLPLVMGAFLAARRPSRQSPVTPPFAIGALLAGTLVGIGSTVSAVLGGDS